LIGIGAAVTRRPLCRSNRHNAFWPL